MKVNEARGAKDTLGIVFWGILSYLLHPRSPTHRQHYSELGESSGELDEDCLMEVPVTLHESASLYGDYTTELPMHSYPPPSPDYVPGPEHPPSPDYVPSPEHPLSPVEVPYVPEPEYPEYLAPSDVEAPLEDQPLPADASPTALSPGYVADFDPDEDPEEDLEEDNADGLNAL
ncbi:hypothetical protein Tco_1132413 [Tanacetum coccineum]|uniref:Uncharacterized protein n=1 Tax=Tanacetum coccineum TaxID=301880 RepID=A0ABQ5JBU7_9ASTR